LAFRQGLIRSLLQRYEWKILNEIMKIGIRN